MRLLNGVLGMALLGLAACAELGIQPSGTRGPAPGAVRPVPVDEALSDVGRFPVKVEEERVVELRPPPPLPKLKPEVTQAALDATREPQADPDALVGVAGRPGAVDRRTTCQDLGLQWQQLCSPHIFLSESRRQ